MYDSNDGPAKKKPWELLCHPAVLLCVIVVAVNDHLLKGSGWLPGMVTGKLSDVAGLFFFPVLMAVLLYLVALGLGRYGDSMAKRRRLLIDSAVVITVIGFSAVNVVEPVNALAERYWGVFTMDPTDLFCLPMVLVARWFMLRRWERSEEKSALERTAASGAPFRWPHFAAIFIAALVSIATPASAPPPVTLVDYPYWSLIDHTTECRSGLEITSWIAKSGKSGAGMVLRFESTTGEKQTVSVEDATMQVWRPSPEDPEQPRDDEASGWGSMIVVDGEATRPVQVEEEGSIYIAFAFDNDRAWNKQMRRATVKVDLHIDGEPTRVSYRAVHRDVSLRQDYAEHGADYSRYDDPVDVAGEVRATAGAPGGYAISIDVPQTGGCPELDDE